MGAGLSAAKLDRAAMAAGPVSVPVVISPPEPTPMKDGLDAPEELPKKKAKVEEATEPLESLEPMKVTFYELLIRQLQDDGFVDEAQSLSQTLKIQPNTRVEKDALLEAYNKSLKWVFGDEPQGNWTPVECTPVPPLGAQENVLDFDILPAAATVRTDNSDVPVGPMPKPTSPVAPVQPDLGQVSRRPPDVKLLYSAPHKTYCRAVAFSTDGRFCATGSADGMIKVLDCQRMRHYAASADGPMGRSRLTEEDLNKPVTRILQDHVLGITCLAFHPMNPTLYSGSIDKAVKIFDLTRPPGHKKAFSILQDVHPVRCLSIHPCGDFLLVGTAHQAIRLYDLQTLNCFTTFHQDHHHGSGVNDIRCSSDGRMFASASGDGAIQIWDAVTQRVANRLVKAHSGSEVTSLRWSRNLKYLLSAGVDGRQRLWDVRQGKEIFSMGFGPRSCDFNLAVFAAGERFVVSASSNIKSSDVSVFDAQTGKALHQKLSQHLQPVRALDASPVDKTIMTGCDDMQARYFALNDGIGSA